MHSIDALAVREEGNCVGILINSRAYTRRSCFSFAHEIGHVLCGHVFDIAQAIDSRTSFFMNRAADAFAAELTMPKRAITYRKWTVESLSDECGVSRQAAAIRLEELGIVA